MRLVEKPFFSIMTIMNCLKKTLVLLLFTVVSCQSSRWNSDVIKLSDNEYTHCSNDSMCPTWFICNSEKKCQCGNGHTDAIVCDDKSLTSAILDCHCVTYDGESQSTFVGSCFYNCENHKSERERDLVYHQLPKEREMLINRSVCSYFHRTGLLCVDCEGGHSPLVLSYNLSCVRCPDGHKNWWKFILVCFLPLTMFYLFVVVFNVNVTSSRLHGVVWFSQTLSMPAFVRVVMSSLSHGDPWLLKATQAFAVFYSFWNLDLFRSVIPEICLNVTTLQTLALEYLVALYPFVLILCSYFIIELYDKRVAFIVTAWKPLHKMLTIFRMSWDVRTSVIDSFATFFLLSYVKILSVSTDLLVPTQVYQLGSSKSIFGLYYSPSVIYFGHDHFPYAILAIVILTLFVSIPTITLVFILFSSFKSFSLFFHSTGTFFMLLLTPFKVATRMGQNLEYLTAVGFQH